MSYMYEEIYKDIERKWIRKIWRWRNVDAKKNEVISIRGSFGTGKTHNFWGRAEKSPQWKGMVKIIEDRDDLRLLAKNQAYVNSITKKGVRARISNSINDSKVFDWSTILVTVFSCLTIIVPLILATKLESKWIAYFLLVIPFILLLFKLSTYIFLSVRNKIIFIENSDRLEYDIFIKICSNIKGNKNLKNCFIIMTFDTENLHDRYMEKYTFGTPSIPNYIEKYFDSNYFLDPELNSNLNILDESLKNGDYYVDKVMGFIKKTDIKNLRFIKEAIIPLIKTGALEGIDKYLALNIEQYIYIQTLKETKYELFRYLMNNRDIFEVKFRKTTNFGIEYVYRVLNKQLSSKDKVKWHFFEKIKYIKDSWPEELPNVIGIIGRGGNRSAKTSVGHLVNDISVPAVFEYYFKNSNVINDINFLNKAVKTRGIQFIELIEQRSDDDIYIIGRLNAMIKSEGNSSDIFNGEVVEEIFRERSDYKWTLLVRNHFSNANLDKLGNKIEYYAEAGEIDIAYGMLSLTKHRFEGKNLNILKQYMRDETKNITMRKIIATVDSLEQFTISWYAMIDFISEMGYGNDILTLKPKLFEYWIDSEDGEDGGDHYSDKQVINKMLKEESIILGWLDRNQQMKFMDEYDLVFTAKEWANELKSSKKDEEKDILAFLKD